MPVKDEVEGEVVEELPNTTFRVQQLDSGHEVLACSSGTMRTHSTRILPGARVKVDDDLNRGRITNRFRRVP